MHLDTPWATASARDDEAALTNLRYRWQVVAQRALGAPTCFSDAGDDAVLRTGACGTSAESVSAMGPTGCDRRARGQAPQGRAPCGPVRSPALRRGCDCLRCGNRRGLKRMIGPGLRCPYGQGGARGPSVVSRMASRSARSPWVQRSAIQRSLSAAAGRATRLRPRSGPSSVVVSPPRHPMRTWAGERPTRGRATCSSRHWRHAFRGGCDRLCGSQTGGSLSPIVEHAALGAAVSAYGTTVWVLARGAASSTRLRAHAFDRLVRGALGGHRTSIEG